jgi:hypothetical protein
MVDAISISRARDDASTTEPARNASRDLACLPRQDQVLGRSPNPSRVMLKLEWIWESRNRTPVVLISMGVVLLIAVLDWRTKAYVSLDFLYLFPIMLAAAFYPVGESF